MEKETIRSGNIIDFKILKRILLLTKPYKKTFYLLIVLTFLLGVLAPIRPVLVQYTLDHHVAYGNYEDMAKVILLLVGLLIVYASFQYLNIFIAGHIGQHIIRDLRVRLYSHLINFKLSFFNKTPVGRLVTRTISDIETLADVFSEGLAALISDLLQIIFIIIFMLIINWRLALISLSIVPLMILATYIFKEKVKIAFNDVRNAISNLNSFVQESLTGMSIVQIFGNEKHELKKFYDINKKHRSAHLKAVLYYSIYFPVVEILSALGIGLLIWYGAGEAIMSHAKVTVGTLTAFIMYIQMFFRPIRMIADRYNVLQMGIVSTARIMNLLDTNDHLLNRGHTTLSHVKGKVAFKNVWFAYKGSEYVLKNITLSARPGETVALVGATGAGKSSIISLLNRFYEINRGTIEVDDIDIRQLTLASLRKEIGVVLQDVFLFSNTIRYNITLGNSTITNETIMKAAELVGARSFIERMPNGLDYNVMERGATLSIGQRQLLCFIRAMVYDPKILILDEATSSIDHESEKMIQRAIEKMMDNRTAIVIAHRLATIYRADKIIVLDKGEVKEVGQHKTLLQLNGYYARFHEMQYKA